MESEKLGSKSANDVGIVESGKDEGKKDPSSVGQRLGSVGSSESSDGTVTTVTKVHRKDWESATCSSDDRSTDTLNDISSQEDSSPEKQCIVGNEFLLKNTIEDGTKDEKDNNNGNGDVTAARPESLSLPCPLQHLEKRRTQSDSTTKMHKSYTGAIEIPNKDSEFENIEETLLSKSMPHGAIIHRQGDLFEFVAEDLQEKIRRSSPLTKTESSGLSSRASSLRSLSSISSNSSAVATSAMSRSPSSQFQQSPTEIPPIDPMAVVELEMQARKVADSIDLLMGNLKSNLYKMSAITVGCLDAYKTSVDTTCDSVDSSIKSMYALMAKCEELSNSMKPVYKLANQMYPLKRQFTFVNF
ncbi:hypothetical protein FSP39_010897 [Pinctada imbricata]|uniref:BLOC-1-related complex subunit 6 C-terminal helix domain-containing protein n=1 Tax=Pinctada imbricata TaxID=66713 RepID=A0AA88YCV7_PINIB|nr:hypothetical protein FSP39_010897 [Pinctada imbricata]